jgi:Ca-activated chloride channel family protein
VELRVRLGDGVQLLQAYGSRRLNEAEAARVRATEVAIDNQEAHRSAINVDRQEDREGGMRFFIPGFARDDEHTILLRLQVPAGAAGLDLALASVELRYKDRVLGANGGDERQVRAGYASSALESEASQDVAVRRAVYAFRTGEELVNLSALLSQGAQQEALQALWERVEVLRGASERLGDAGLRADAERLDGMRQAVLARSMGNDLRTGSMLQRAGNAFMR